MIARLWRVCVASVAVCDSQTATLTAHTQASVAVCDSQTATLATNPSSQRHTEWSIFVLVAPPSTRLAR